MAVDPDVGQWFRQGILYAAASNLTVSSRWGDVAITSSIDSPLAGREAAEQEGARQLAFWGDGPIVQDEHLVPGDRKDLRLRCIILRIDRLGYDDGVPAFVLGTEPADGSMTRLIVLRRL